MQMAVHRGALAADKPKRHWIRGRELLEGSFFRLLESRRARLAAQTA
jgi:hypothetical protein